MSVGYIPPISYSPELNSNNESTNDDKKIANYSVGGVIGVGTYGE